MQKQLRIRTTEERDEKNKTYKTERSYRKKEKKKKKKKKKKEQKQLRIRRCRRKRVSFPYDTQITATVRSRRNSFIQSHMRHSLCD